MLALLVFNPSQERCQCLQFQTLDKKNGFSITVYVITLLLDVTRRAKLLIISTLTILYRGRRGALPDFFFFFPCLADHERDWPPCVCVCVFFPSILDIKFVGRTSRGHTGGRSHRIFNPPSFCGACLDFCREKDSAIPFPRRP